MTTGTETFTFSSIDGEPVPNLKHWYNDPGMIGRHFLVFNVASPRVKRHYTICSSMQPVLHSELLKLAENIVSGDPNTDFDNSIFVNNDKKSISLTLKTYHTKTGLATKIHSTAIDPEMAERQAYFDDLTTDNAYSIKGPMGKGLQVKTSGVHVAFCAGTGALVFLDLVSHLLIKNCFEADGKKVPEEMSVYEADFVFHLYCSFADRESAIGLQIIEALEKVNAKLGLSNFKATVRLSKTDGPKLPRWSPTYISDELTPLAGSINRIWVVGPPAVNEMFDKTLEAMTGDL